MSNGIFTTNSSTNTAVSGIGAGDSINKVELVWIKVGTDDSGGADLSNQTNLNNAAVAAITAGRTLTLTAGVNDAAIAALQTTAGTTQSVGTLVAGVNYVPAIRWTENMNGGGTQAGVWTKGTAQTFYTAHAEFNGSSVDTGFSAVVAGDGAVTVSGGYATISDSMGTNVAFIRLDSALASNKVFTVTVKGKINTGASATGLRALGLVNSAAAPGSMTSAQLTANEIMAIMVRPDASQFIAQYLNSSSATTPAIGSAGWNSGLPAGTEYQFSIVSDATKWRMYIKSADGSSTIQQSADINWSATKTIANSLWLWVGDPSNETDGATMMIDWIHVI